ncbi:mate-domain-containing protein [Chytridium lagenaria]|nr:mate-domain-containing protein [Chytridium lagenaria]
MIPGLFPYFVSEAVKRFLQSQGIMSASMVIILVVSPINIILQYILVWSSWNIGVLGAPIAISCSYWILAILMILYVLFVRGGDCWGGIESRELFCSQKLWQFTSLGAPGIAMLASEWWAFEIVALGSGLLGESYLAAQTIVLNTCGLTYMIPLGFSIAATARIGNALGAECPNRARASAFGALAIGQCLALVNSLVLFAIKDSWGLLWTEDVTVVKIVAEILPLAAVFQISDASGAISGGVLRGIGRQEIGAYLNILAYYFIGLPFGFYACFPLKLGLFGLWLGLTVGLIMVSAIQIVIIFRTDWNLESQRAHDLVFSKPLLDHDESGSRTPENV